MKFFAVFFMVLFMAGVCVYKSDAVPPFNACTETCFNGGSVTECCRAHGYKEGRCSDDGVNGKRAYCS